MSLAHSPVLLSCTIRVGIPLQGTSAGPTRSSGFHHLPPAPASAQCGGVMIAAQPLTVTWGQPSRFQLNPRMNDDSCLPSRPVRVLLVEDSLPVRERVRSLIEEFGPVEVVGETGTVAARWRSFTSTRRTRWCWT